MAKTPVKKNAAKTARSSGTGTGKERGSMPTVAKRSAGKAAPKGISKAGGKGKTKATARSTSHPALPPTSSADAAILDRLFEVVTSRRGTDPTLSHSARLLSRGTRKIAQKFGEEAVECLIEAVAGRPQELIGESADVLYHLIVMWVDAGVTPAEVWNELTRREGTSGIEEKASRTPTA